MPGAAAVVAEAAETLSLLTGFTRTSRVSPGRSVALYESAITPLCAPDHRSVTSPEPVKPTCDQFTLTVALPDVPVLNSATTYSPLFSRLLKTCLTPLFTTRFAATPSWSTPVSRSLVSIALSTESRWVRSVPSSNGEAAITHSVKWERR